MQTRTNNRMMTTLVAEDTKRKHLMAFWATMFCLSPFICAGLLIALAYIF